MQELTNIYKLLCEFLGEPKHQFNGDNYQLQFDCPSCAIEKGLYDGDHKYNLEINIQTGKFNCWACGVHNNMHGNISKLIKEYGNDKLLKEYYQNIRVYNNSLLYELNSNDINNHHDIDDSIIDLPKYFTKFENSRFNFNQLYALSYLTDRNINFSLIERFNIGYCTNGEYYNRIIIPSYDKNDTLNYFVGRDYSNNQYKLKYKNPNIPKTDFVFNEKFINWDDNIILVEGPFDHIVTPNSIPLLGKKLSEKHVLYHEILSKAKQKVIIFLDGDAYNDIIKLYKILNVGPLLNKIMIIDLNKDLDPSKVYEMYGPNGIYKAINSAYKPSDISVQIN